MKRDNIVIINEFLVTQVNHWTLFAVAVVITLFFQEFPQLWMSPLTLLEIWTFCGLLPFFLFLVREKAHRFWVFCLLHLAGAGGVFLLSGILPGGNAGSRIIAGAVSIFYFVHSLYLHFSPRGCGWDSKYPVPVLAALPMVSLFLQHYRGISSMDRYFIVCFIAVIGMYLISYYLESYLNFLDLNTQTTGYLPEREMFRSGIRLVLLYTAGTGLLLICTANYEWLSVILKTLQNLVRQILRFLVSLLPKSEETNEPLIQEAVPGQGMMEMPEPGESFWLWDLLAVIAQIAVIVFLAVICYKAVRRGIQYLREHFKRERIEVSGADDVVFDVREKCDVDSRKRKRGMQQVLQAFTPSERIRRYFKKRVLSEKKLFGQEENPAGLSQYTARECADKIGIPSLAVLYEKARYSKEGAAPEDVKKMKQALRNGE